MILDLLRADRRVDRSRVCIDHCEEHTIRLVLDEGYWAGVTLYPLTKATPERAADMVEIYGPERILVNSSADWGPSNPLAVSQFIEVMRRRGHTASLVRRLVWENPLEFFSQSRNFHFAQAEALLISLVRLQKRVILPVQLLVARAGQAGQAPRSSRPE